MNEEDRCENENIFEPLQRAQKLDILDHDVLLLRFTPKR